MPHNHFNPCRGGHAPGHVRGFFFALLDPDESEVEATCPYRLPDVLDPLVWVAGRLHNCTDVMPGDWQEYFDFPPGDRQVIETYAMGARWILGQLSDPSSPVRA